MRFSGKIYKDGKFWLAEIPILDAITQGNVDKASFSAATPPRIAALTSSSTAIRLPPEKILSCLSLKQGLK